MILTEAIKRAKIPHCIQLYFVVSDKSMYYCPVLSAIIMHYYELSSHTLGYSDALPCVNFMHCLVFLCIVMYHDSIIDYTKYHALFANGC